MKKILLWIGAAVAVVGLFAAALFFLRCEHHWQEATCESPAICTRCKAYRGKALGHQWLEADCLTKRTCSRCALTKGEALGHLFADATCLLPKTCSRCSLTEGEPLGHRWTDATCVKPKTCSACAETEGEALGHQWVEATCLAPRHCSVCSVTQGEKAQHSFLKATCLAPETCSLCALTRGEKSDHSWKSATCSSPQTCSVCRLTRGEALGHIWMDATCVKPKTCSRCSETQGKALGHQFVKDVDGKTKHCSVCGKDIGIKYVAITFDDGPSGNVTKTLLEGLKARNVKATFFVCGYRIHTYPTLPQTILAQGHELGLHTMDHKILTTLGREGIRQQLEGMLSLLPADGKVTLMRPPGGGYNATVKEVCKELGLSVIMWSVDPKDWATGSSSQVANSVVSGTYDGSIILLHDLRTSSVQGALSAIDRLQAMGYEFVTVSELARIKGYTPEAGEVYHSFK